MFTRPRQPKGTPAGGRFTSRSRTVSDVSINQPFSKGDTVHIPTRLGGQDVFTAEATGRVLSDQPYDRDGEQTVQVVVTEDNRTTFNEYPTSNLRPYPLPGLTSS